jgi:hypothetical protein
MTGLIQRLSSQVGSKELAMNLLKKRGHVDSEGNLTRSGKERDSLGAEGRAKDRASKRSGKTPSAYKYNSKTNRATLKK